MCGSMFDNGLSYVTRKKWLICMSANWLGHLIKSGCMLYCPWDSLYDKVCILMKIKKKVMGLIIRHSCEL